MKRLVDMSFPPLLPTSKTQTQPNVVDVHNKPAVLLQIQDDTLVRRKSTEVHSDSSPFLSEKEEEKESSSVTASSKSFQNSLQERPPNNHKISILHPKSTSHPKDVKPRRPPRRQQQRHKKKNSRPDEEEDRIPGLQLTMMADSEFSLGHIQSAFVFWDQALQIQRHQLGDRHPVVAQTLCRRGRAFAQRGYLFEATLDFEQAVHIQEDHLQDDDDDHYYSITPHDNHHHHDDRMVLDTADTILQMAHLQQERGYYVEAMQGLSKALLLKKGVLGTKYHESIASIVCTMGNFYHRRRKYEDALYMYHTGLALYKEMGIPPTHPCIQWVKRCLSDKNILAMKTIWSPEKTSKNATRRYI
eukprot:CAMPEP_0195285824 /NCGR_PEP_ID=MMETSP0707-20130614/3517_1 /TAXON_ID=33640 /ORGANISM="Asterionellopsis glacialis, Strain CCMP134" /LENGTH=357 /DNA_ID=CAMNT_0040345377 /DNA_START=182 /DNA_END=1255 /DNA_ORIENTATION=+